MFLKREKYIITMLAGFLFINLLNYPVTAKYIDNIISNFEENSPEYLTVVVDNELQLLDDYKNASEIENIANKIETAESKIISLENQYEQSTDILEMVSIQMSIQEQQIYIYDLKHQELNLTLSQNLDNAYSEVSDLIIYQQQNLLKYDMYSSANSAILLEKEIDYYSVLEEEKKEYIEIEKSKFKEGYSKQSDITALEAELSTIQSEKFNIETQLELLENKIQLNSQSDYYSDAISIEIFSDDCFDAFLENDYKIPYIKLQITAYEIYIEDLKLLLNELSMEGYDFDSAERMERTIENEIIYYEKYIEKLDLDLKQYETDLKIYVLTIEKNYCVYEKQLESKKLEIDSAKEQLKITESLYAEGYARPVDILTKKSQIAKLEAEKTEIEKQMSDYAYILSNYIINI